MSDEGVELAEAIGMVREQLLAAQQAGRESAGELTFLVSKVTVEFVGEMRKTTGASGSVKFWVVSADAKGERTSVASQKVTVELATEGSDGRTYQVSDVGGPPLP